ncbi:MAG: glycosyltransferase [Deltaproteobacteria bacterium]|nr:glycosyltransferase [Deltaproteobacteria bacterium]
MKLAALSSFSPIHPNDAGSPRLYCLCREWAKENQVSFIFYGDQNSYSQINTANHEIFHHCHHLPAEQASSFFGRLAHRSLLPPYYWQKLKQKQHFQRTKQLLEQICRDNNFDLLILHGPEMIQFLPLDSISRDKIIVDLVDSFSLANYRRYQKLTAGKAKLLCAADILWSRHFERMAIKNSKFVSVVSDYDQQWINNKLNTDSIKFIPNGVDTDYFSFTPNLHTNPNRIVFLGSMNYEPNVHAVLAFSRLCFPELKRNLPDLEFFIVGANPTDAVRNLESISGITVTGYVEDVRPYLRQAKAMICPMSLGAGIKNKILQAMALGLPVIGTSIAFQGITSAQKGCCLTADTPQELIAETLRLLKTSDLSLDLTQNAHKHICQNYSWSNAAQAFLSRLS